MCFTRDFWSGLVTSTSSIITLKFLVAFDHLTCLCIHTNNLAFMHRKGILGIINSRHGHLIGQEGTHQSGQKYHSFSHCFVTTSTWAWLRPASKPNAYAKQNISRYTIQFILYYPLLQPKDLQVHPMCM